MIPVTSIPRSSLSKTYHTTTPERKARWSPGRPTEKLPWNFKGPLEATYGKQRLEVWAPARTLFLFNHSRFDHTQKASKFPKYVNLTIESYKDPLPALVSKLRPKESQQQEIKSNSDNAVGGRTASHKARGTNSSVPRAQPSQAGKVGTAWGGTETTFVQPWETVPIILQSWSLSHGAMEYERSRSEEQTDFQAIPKKT